MWPLYWVSIWMTRPFSIYQKVWLTGHMRRLRVEQTTSSLKQLQSAISISTISWHYLSHEAEIWPLRWDEQNVCIHYWSYGIEEPLDLWLGRWSRMDWSYMSGFGLISRFDQSGWFILGRKRKGREWLGVCVRWGKCDWVTDTYDTGSTVGERRADLPSKIATEVDWLTTPLP